MNNETFFLFCSVRVNGKDLSLETKSMNMIHTEREVSEWVNLCAKHPPNPVPPQGDF